MFLSKRFFHMKQSQEVMRMRDPVKLWDNMAKNVDPQSDQLDENQSRMVQKISKHLHEHDVVLDYGYARGGISLALALKKQNMLRR